jgi:hypothetical protein
MAAASGSLDLDESFYGDQDFDMEDFDKEGFSVPTWKVSLSLTLLPIT